MVAIAIFWAAVMAILFFLIGIVFKGLASVFNALLSSIGTTVVIGGCGLLAFLALYAIYGIVDGIITGGIWDTLGMIVLLVIEIGIVVALLGGLGSVIIGVIITVATFVLEIVSGILEGAAALSEKAYSHFLLVIVKRLEKC